MLSQKPTEEQYLEACYLGDDKRQCFNKGYIAGIQEVLSLLYDRGTHVDRESDHAYWCAQYVLSQLTPETLQLFCPKCHRQHIDTLEADGTDWHGGHTRLGFWMYLAQVIDLGMDQDMLRFVLLVAFAGVAAIGLAFARWS